MVILVTTGFTIYSIVRTPSFQQLAGRLVADFLSRKYGLEIYLDKVRISDALTLDVSGLKLMDHRRNELLNVGSLSLNIRDLSLQDGYIRLSYVSLHNTGFFLHTYENDSVSNLTHLLKSFKTTAPDTVSGKEPLEIRCDGLSLDNVSFGFTDDHYTHPGEVMDFKDILLTDIFLFANDISVTGDSISADIKHLSCFEKSGFRLNEFSASASVSPTGIRASDLDVKTRGIHASMDVDFLYNGFDKLSYFLDSVFIDARIHESVLTLSDIGYFAAVLKPMDDPVMFSGDVKGFISDFRAEDFRFNLGNFTEFRGNISMTGIPDFNSTYNILEIEQFIFSPQDIEGFSLPLKGPNLILPEQVHYLGLTSLSGTFEGVITNFQADLNVDSEIGSLTAYGSLAEDPVTKEPLYFGDIAGTSVNLDVISGLPELGLIDVNVEFEGKSFDPQTMNVTLNGWIENFEFRDYRYDKIVFGGELIGLSYNGSLSINDPGLNLAFSGKVDFNDEVPRFDFETDLLLAKLYDLHLADRSEDMQLKVHLAGNFSGIKPEDFDGIIKINNLSYLENGRNYLLDSLLLDRSRQQNGDEILVLRSDFVDADINGDIDFSTFTEDLMSFVLDNDDSIAASGSKEISTKPLSFDIRFKDLHPVTELFIPSIRIAPGSHLSGDIDFAGRTLDFQLTSDSVFAGSIMLDRIAINGRTGSSGRLEVLADIGMIILSENQDTVVMGLPDFRFAANAGNDSIACRITWDNGDEIKTNRADISAYVLIPSDYRMEADIRDATASFNGASWKVEGESYVVIDSAFKEVRDLIIAREGQRLTIDGRLSDKSSDTMSLHFKDWSLSYFNALLQNSSLSLGGIINGSMGYSRENNAPDIFADLRINDLVLNDVLFGNAKILTHWLESDEALSLNADIFSSVSVGEPYKILGVKGFYYPFDRDQNFDLDVTTQNLDISIIEPYLSSFSSYIAGFATGRLNLLGTTDKPILTGRMKLQRAELKVDYLNVTYSFSNEVIVEENFIHFNRVPIYDPNSNEGYIEGGIRHRYFKDITLDLQIEPNNFLALKLTRYQNETFYGTAYATGKVNISGPLNNISMEIVAKTEKGTDVHIPINYSVDVSQGDFIIFTDQKDTLLGEGISDIQVKGVSLDFGLNVTRDANIEISLPGDIGFIKANGKGDLRLGVDAAGYLTLKGSYVISSGLFLFSLEQLVSRRFEILEGSSISWTGDINDADVNIVARYRLRTSLTGLGSTLIDPEAANQKVVVFTDIRMTGNLFNPDLSFGIYFPNMREQERQAVYAVLDTNDQGVMNQQALSLLVLNSFSSSGSGVSNPVNPAAIMSNTLSSVLSQISNDFNIGINYVPGDRVTDEQLEVALSTQLLDDRLTIDGNLDVSSNNNETQGTSSIVGDVIVEYKLTADGRFRVKAFNRSNDLSLLTNYSPYTQGVGIFYRREFNNLPELFTRKKNRKPETIQ